MRTDLYASPSRRSGPLFTFDEDALGDDPAPAGGPSSGSSFVDAAKGTGAFAPDRAGLVDALKNVVVPGGDGAKGAAPSGPVGPRMTLPAPPDTSGLDRRQRVADIAAIASAAAGGIGALFGPNSAFGTALMGAGAGAAQGAAGMADEQDLLRTQRAESYFSALRDAQEWNLEADRDDAVTAAKERREDERRADERRLALREAEVELAEGSGDSAGIIAAYRRLHPGLDDATLAGYAAERQVDHALARQRVELDVEARRELVTKRQQEILTEIERTGATRALADQRRAQGEAARTRAEAAANRDNARADLYGRTEPGARSAGRSSAPPPPPAVRRDVSSTDADDALRFYQAGQLTADEYEEITGRRPPR